MPETLVILSTTIFVNNFVMVQFLGLCPFMGASQRIDAALGMSAATTFVLTLACGISYLLDTYVLKPFDLEYLRIIAFIVVIASLVQFSQIVMKATQPLLHEVLLLLQQLLRVHRPRSARELRRREDPQSLLEELQRDTDGASGRGHIHPGADTGTRQSPEGPVSTTLKQSSIMTAIG